ncbi:SDR family oxidoreductase [Tahibacter harae]|uniref:SDR family oxidoreductase n=1 Tax=Tahibacter harae TaxID=2963937 RepID=A0ABT1QW29_9GAMM|nr:SDR family oxidoreductase [Tahibacter harae]MCQ4166491.1 SDR family oxidoreductase [Tahibacter harae]
MDLQLAGKTAIVTGASRGIGRAIAVALAAEGASVVAVARSGDALRQLVGALPVPGLAVAADLREDAAAEHVVAQALGLSGRLDILVNNAGATVRGDFLALDDGAWQDGFALKFFGAMRLCRAAWPSLRARAGAIVNVVGIGGRSGSAEFSIGGAVNAALLNLTKALADRGVADGVRVNAVNPSSIATDRLQARVRTQAAAQGVDEAEAARRIAAELRVARFGTPEEIAAAVVFLASPRAAYCQGTILDVDGGQTRTL